MNTIHENYERNLLSNSVGGICFQKGYWFASGSNHYDHIILQVVYLKTSRYHGRCQEFEKGVLGLDFDFGWYFFASFSLVNMRTLYYFVTICYFSAPRTGLNLIILTVTIPGRFPAGEGSIENKPDVNTPACRRRRLNGGIWGRTRGPTSRNILPKTNMAPVGERRLWRMLGRESNIGLDVWLFGAYLPSGRALIIIPLDRPIWECVMSWGEAESLVGRWRLFGESSVP